LLLPGRLRAASLVRTEAELPPLPDLRQRPTLSPLSPTPFSRGCRRGERLGVPCVSLSRSPCHDARPVSLSGPVVPAPFPLCGPEMPRALDRPCVCVGPSWPGTTRYDGPVLGPSTQPVGDPDTTGGTKSPARHDMELSGPPRTRARAGPSGSNGHL
jgi:hypothetical protein